MGVSRMSDGGRGWFADVDPEYRGNDFKWQPCLETGEGHIPCFEVWFDTKQACEDWIREYVLAVGLLDFPDELWERAQRYAGAHEIAVSVVVRDALEEFLRRNEK